eukprot:gene21397-biopygen17174
MLHFGGAGVLPLMSCRARRTACSESELLGAMREVYAYDVSQLLAAIWFHLTHLETGTKESNKCASLGVTETRGHNESKGCLAAEVRSSFYVCEA